MSYVPVPVSSPRTLTLTRIVVVGVTVLYAMRCPGDIEGICSLDMQPTFTSLRRSHAKSEKGFYIANDPQTSGSRE